MTDVGTTHGFTCDEKVLGAIAWRSGNGGFGGASTLSSH